MSEEEYSEEEVSEEEEEEAGEDPEEAKRKEEEEKKRKAAEERKQAEARRAEEAKRAQEEAVLSKEEEARLKEEEKERKRAEVRAKLEAQTTQTQKKGFLTGARKKKLKAFLRKKIREDIEAEQKRVAAERQKVLNERIRPVSIEGKNENQLRDLIGELYKRICELDEERYDIQLQIDKGDKQINDLTIEVNKLRGKFVKPVLKKISKYDNKFAKMSKAVAKPEVDYRAALKSTGESKFKVETGDETDKKEKPEWAEKK